MSEENLKNYAFAYYDKDAENGLLTLAGASQKKAEYCEQNNLHVKNYSIKELAFLSHKSDSVLRAVTCRPEFNKLFIHNQEHKTKRVLPETHLTEFLAMVKQYYNRLDGRFKNIRA